MGPSFPSHCFSPEHSAHVEGNTYLFAIIVQSTGSIAEALEEAIETHGCPEIFNTDQGSQFTSADFTNVLKANNIQISMDGKGCWVDNVFVERLWRSEKYEEVYLKAYDDVRSAKRSLDEYFRFYNSERRHQNLDDQTPDRVYNQPAARLAA